MDSDSDLVDWFTAHNGTFDRAALTFTKIEGLGWGAFALRDIQVPRFGIIIIIFFFLVSAEIAVNSTRCNCSRVTYCSPYPDISHSRREPPLFPL